MGFLFSPHIYGTQPRGSFGWQILMGLSGKSRSYTWKTLLWGSLERTPKSWPDNKLPQQTKTYSLWTAAAAKHAKWPYPIPWCLTGDHQPTSAWPLTQNSPIHSFALTRYNPLSDTGHYAASCLVSSCTIFVHSCHVASHSDSLCPVPKGVYAVVSESPPSLIYTHLVCPLTLSIASGSNYDTIRKVTT